MPLKKQEINNIENENKKTKNEINNNKLKENMNNKNLNVPLFNINIGKNKEYDSCEILLPIIHRYKSEINKSIIPITYQYFYNFQDFIILNSSNSVKPYHLYEIMWKKYMYFLNCPSNYDNNVWWKIKKRDKKPVPFIITIINKENAACAYCPWFRLCTGCILNPSNSEYITINSNSVIVIEWDKDVFTKEINKNNLSLIMDHNSTKTVSDKTKNESNKISIDDCLKLFTKSEEIKDIQCEKCKKKTLFKKTLEIERLPKYLVIVLKRFKYILTSPVKITNLIHFPLEGLPLQNYVSQKNMNYKYNLLGVINHSGTLEGGHYNSTFFINNSWFSFDDNFVEESKGGIETSKVYMLIYKSMKTDSQQKDQNLNFVGLMDRAYRIYLGRTKFKYLFNYIYDENNNIINEYLNSCEFYYGEPVIVDGKNGFIVDIKKEKEKKNDVVKIKVKLKKGFFNERINVNKIFKETFKKKNHIDIELFLNKGKSGKNIKIKESDIVCGSQVCFIF
jgi:predicted nucleic acid-binding Zn finger protein/DNA-directed RNA polymerase subunit RPC12/RpoP